MHPPRVRTDEQREQRRLADAGRYKRVRQRMGEEEKPEEVAIAEEDLFGDEAEEEDPPDEEEKEEDDESSTGRMAEYQGEGDERTKFQTFDPTGAEAAEWRADEAGAAAAKAVVRAEAAEEATEVSRHRAFLAEQREANLMASLARAELRALD